MVWGEGEGDGGRGWRVGANGGDYIRGETRLRGTFSYLFRRLDINRGSCVQCCTISEILGKCDGLSFRPTFGERNNTDSININIPVSGTRGGRSRQPGTWNIAYSNRGKNNYTARFTLQLYRLSYQRNIVSSSQFSTCSVGVLPLAWHTRSLKGTARSSSLSVANP